MTLKIMSKQCETCIFGKKSPIPDDRFNELKSQWAIYDTIQQCHHATAHGKTHGCRGHYESARRGEIPHPVIGIAASMGIVGIPVKDIMQIYERMQFIVFVDIND